MRRELDLRGMTEMDTNIVRSIGPAVLQYKLFARFAKMFHYGSVDGLGGMPACRAVWSFEGFVSAGTLKHCLETN